MTPEGDPLLSWLLRRGPGGLLQCGERRLKAARRKLLLPAPQRLGSAPACRGERVWWLPPASGRACSLSLLQHCRWLPLKPDRVLSAHTPRVPWAPWGELGHPPATIPMERGSRPPRQLSVVPSLSQSCMRPREQPSSETGDSDELCICNVPFPASGIGGSFLTIPGCLQPRAWSHPSWSPEGLGQELRLWGGVSGPAPPSGFQCLAQSLIGDLCGLPPQPPTSHRLPTWNRAAVLGLLVVSGEGRGAQEFAGMWGVHRQHYPTPFTPSSPSP